MRSISIRDDIETVLLQYARALPEVFTEFDISRVVLEQSHEDGYDIVYLESEDTEVVLGEVWLDEDYVAYFDMFD